MHKEGLMSIGELSKRSGVSIRAIRYYEERGLLSPAARTEGNYRLYEAHAVAVLTTIGRLRMLGLGLKDIVKLQHVYARVGKCNGTLLESYVPMLEERIRDADRQIRELQLLKEELTRHRDRLLASVQTEEREAMLEKSCRILLTGSRPVRGTGDREGE